MTAIKKIAKKLSRHLLFNREIYIFPFIAVVLLLCSVFGVHALTGRPIVDDPGVMVGFSYNFCGLILLSVLVGIVQTHLFGYRSWVDRDPLPDLPPGLPRFRDDVYDACVSAFLFLFFGWLLWR